jgi:Secretion system C-terminal sorting domain/von Willebrand factor type A domain
MKHTFSILLMTCIANLLFAQNKLHITTRAMQTNTPIQNATIIIKKGNKKFTQLVSNRFGEVEFDIANGTYTMSIIAIGYDSICAETIEINNHIERKIFVLHTSKQIIKNSTSGTVMATGSTTLAVSKGLTVEKEKNKIAKKDKKEGVMIAEKSRTKSKILSPPSMKMMATKVDKEPSDYAKSSIEYITDASPTYDDDAGLSPMIETTLKPEAKMPKTKAGTLTTGEVNDFTKWKLYEEVSRDELNKHLETWQYYMERRYCVQAINANNNPVVNASVQLLADGKIIWQSKTDNTGKAELWAGVHDKEFNKACTIQLLYDGKMYYNLSPTLFEKGINFFQLPVDCNYSNDVDIAFVVDATGSMGDEIQFLKTELNDILVRAQSVNKELQFNTGSVFYQDYGDAYTTVKSDFTNAIATTKSFIDSKNAGGGGDFPEAVDEALTVAIHEMNWREMARTKLLFLVLDAPPHADSATQKRFNQLVADASEKGIRIIPVTASGINKNVEYIMRSVALATNGTYTFLTNHSGVGDSHIAPSTDSFKVEKMNDLLIRLITQFTYIPECKNYVESISEKDKKIQLTDENPFNEWTVTNTINIYPNPNQGNFFVDVPKGSTEVVITDIAGKVMKRIMCTDLLKVDVDITSFASGIYFVRVLIADKWLTGKVMKG